MLQNKGLFKVFIFPLAFSAFCQLSGLVLLLGSGGGQLHDFIAKV